jgi:DNA mismatch repair protein MLH3
MARNSNIGGASIGKSSAGSIQRLPDDVVAQLKSSIAVVSLSGVVIELLKNALDAGATKVEGTVDFGRGACTIEDDGFGIAPFEFREEGGIGKPYCMQPAQ